MPVDVYVIPPFDGFIAWVQWFLFRLQYSLIFKCFLHPFVCVLQKFRQDARTPERGHEICIPIPARHHMNMDMAKHTRTGRLADVRAHVKPVWMIEFSQDVHASRDQLHHFRPCFHVEVFNAGLVLKWNDHEVSACVGKKVEDHIGGFSTEGDQVFRAVCPGLCAAKYTA
jgi:hypothetical protein